MERKLERVEFVRENGDVVKVDAEHVREFEITGIKDTIKYMNGEVHTFISSDDMIFILEDGANHIHKMFNLEAHQVRVFNVLSRNDITCVNFIYSDMSEPLTIYAPWVDDDMHGEKNIMQESSYDKDRHCFIILIGV